MTDLDAMSEATVPRPDRLAQRFARRLEPTWGFVLYGILYAALVANVVGTIPLIFVVSSAWPADPSDAAMLATLGWYVVSQIPMWWLFRRWVRTRRSGPVMLVREGQLLDGTVIAHPMSQTMVGCAISVGDGVIGVPVKLPGDTPCKVLYHPGAKYAFVFGPDGRAVACAANGGGVAPIGPILRESNAEPLPHARLVQPD
jgi:hypothetical protein